MTRDEVLAARTTGWPEAARAALAAVVAELRPSASHLTDILDWLDDITVRDGSAPRTILADERLRAIAAGGGSAPERLKRWKERLRQLRYPRLATRERAIAEHLRTMACGPRLAVAPPAGLEGGVVTFTIRARSTADLTETVEELRTRIARGEVERLFALLDEA